MKQKLQGTYISIDTARAAVNTLLAEGYEKADITLLASSLIADDLTDATHIPVLSNSGNQKSTLNKIRSLFKRGDEAEDVDSDDPLSVYKDDISNGKIVILINEKQPT